MHRFINKLDDEIKQQDYESLLSLMPQSEEQLIIPDNTQEIDSFVVRDKTYLEIITTTQRLVYAVEMYGVRQHLHDRDNYYTQGSGKCFIS